MLETRDTRPSGVTPDNDADWHELITIEIGPHPELSETPEEGHRPRLRDARRRAKIRVRKALLYYALKRLGLDTDPAARRPQDQQIVLLNQEPQLAVVGAMAVEG